MNIGDIKQAIRQRCRMDPRLTDNYILNYIKQGLQTISMNGKTFKTYLEFTGPVLDPNTRRYEIGMGSGTINVDSVEYGTSQQFTNMEQIMLKEGTDYRISKDNTPFTNVMVPYIELFFAPASDYILRIHGTYLIDDLLAVTWSNNGSFLDNVIPRLAVQPLIEYVAYQHKKNYMKDPAVQLDGAEYQNILMDLSQAFNERIEYCDKTIF